MYLPEFSSMTKHPNQLHDFLGSIAARLPGQGQLQIVLRCQDCGSNVPKFRCKLEHKKQEFGQSYLGAHVS